MKKRILILLLTTFSLNLYGQSDVAGEIKMERLKNLYIVNNTRLSLSSKMSIADIYTIGNDWQTVSSRLSINSADCKSQDSGNWCYYKEKGLELAFTDYLGDYSFAYLNINQRGFGMEVNGTLIKPGDSVSILSSIFPNAYQKRSRVPGRNSPGHQVLLYLKDTDLSIAFIYNSLVTKIKSIEVYHSLF